MKNQRKLLFNVLVGLCLLVTSCVKVVEVPKYIYVKPQIPEIQLLPDLEEKHLDLYQSVENENLYCAEYENIIDYKKYVDKLKLQIDTYKNLIKNENEFINKYKSINFEESK